jgi:nitric oxide dioxygenase
MSNHPINRQVKMGLSPETIYIMKSTAPVLQEHGLEITKRLYELMFDRHSYVKNYFNRSHIFPPGGGVSTQVHLYI